MHYVVTYDIHSDRRRRRVLNALKNYGLPVQFSVVECELDMRRLEDMEADIKALINPRTDNVRIYQLCENCFFRAEVFGTHKLSAQKL